MNPRLENLLNSGESRKVEFKSARRALNKDLYETICAFLHRDGGEILLGVDDGGTIVGVEADHIAAMKKDFATTINNPQKIGPPCYLGSEELSHAGHLVRG